MKNRDEWHPVYKTISEWLAAEAGAPDPSIGRTANDKRPRRKPKIPKQRRRVIRA